MTLQPQTSMFSIRILCDIFYFVVISYTNLKYGTFFSCICASAREMHLSSQSQILLAKNVFCLLCKTSSGYTASYEKPFSSHTTHSQLDLSLDCEEISQTNGCVLFFFISCIAVLAVCFGSVSYWTLDLQISLFKASNRRILLYLKSLSL